MSVANGQVSLARFAHNWVGGNIDGLAQLAGTLFGYAPQITGVAGALDTQVRQVVGAAGWRGSAAAAFTSAWGRDSVTARAVGLASDQIAGIVGWLAVTLSRTEAMLEDAADEASAHGVPISPDGQPEDGPLPGAAQQWLSAYQKFYAASMQAAHNARQTAAGALADTARQITDPTGRGLRIAGDSVTAADLLADLLASPSATMRGDRAELAGIEKQLGKLSKQMGESGSVRNFTKDLGELGDRLKQTNADMTVAQEQETALTKLADVRVGDAVEKAMKAWQGGGAHVKTAGGAHARSGEGDVPDGDGEELGKLAKWMRIGEDIPVVDVAAAGLGTALGTYSDVHNGHPLGTSLGLEGASNVGGVAGAAVIAEVAGGPAGMVAGVLLPNSIHNNLTEPWLAEIRQHGVVDGLVQAQGQVGVNNVSDALNTIKDSPQTQVQLDEGALHNATNQVKLADDVAKRAWHDIF